MKDYFVPIATVAITALAAFSGSWIASATKKKEMDLQYIQIALGILREKPDESQISAARSWAIELINETAPIKISEAVRDDLLRRPLPSIGWNPMQFVLPDVNPWIYPDKNEILNNQDRLLKMLQSRGIIEKDFVIDEK